MVVENTGITVSFKLGINRMYVLKDVFGFARAIENHEKVFYGKNLQFIHAVESFVPQSRPLVSFLVQWAEKNEYRYGGYHSYYSVYGNAREMCIRDSIMQDTKDKKQTGKKAYQTRGNSRLVTDTGHFREIEDFADQTIISGSEE